MARPVNIKRSDIRARLQEAGGRLRVRSALNPILWLCGIISIPALVAASRLSDPQPWIIAMACAPVGAAIFGFLFLLIFDRDKLQSEDYQIRKRQLDLIEQKGDLSPMLINPEGAPGISKPDKNGENAGGMP